MASDQSALAVTSMGSATIRIAMDATAGNVVAVTCPPWARSVTVTMLQSDASTADTMKWATSGSDGAAVGNNFGYAASGIAAIPLTGGVGRALGSAVIYLAAGTNSALAQCHFQTAPVLS